MPDHPSQIQMDRFILDVMQLYKANECNHNNVGRETYEYIKSVFGIDIRDHDPIFKCLLHTRANVQDVDSEIKDSALIIMDLFMERFKNLSNCITGFYFESTMSFRNLTQTHPAMVMTVTPYSFQKIKDIIEGIGFGIENILISDYENVKSIFKYKFDDAFKDFHVIVECDVKNSK